MSVPAASATRAGPGVALVTGTSSGFGRAIAAALHGRGYRVYGTTRSPDRPPPPGVRALTMNVDDSASVNDAIAALIGDAGCIDVLVNNAGFGISGAIEDTSEHEARAQLETNLFGTHRVCCAVLPQMRRQGRGRVVNVSSLAGFVAVPYQAFYCASKHAIEAYSEALRMEMKPFGIHVSMVEPGDFATSFTANRRMTAATTADSPHYQRCRQALSRAQEDEQRYTNISPVVNAVLRAVDSPRPSLRYPVATPVQRVLVALKPFVPQRLFEYLIMDNYKLN